MNQVYIDIGSTIIKTVVFNDERKMVSQEFISRDYDILVAEQAKAIIQDLKRKNSECDVRICSSANGGIRVGLISLTRRFSGAVAKNIILSAGANLLFHKNLSDDYFQGRNEAVDLLVITGGVDLHGMASLEKRLAALDLNKYHFRHIIYAGNQYIFDRLFAHRPEVQQVDNIINLGLENNNNSLMNVIRKSYLDDLVDRQGMNLLKKETQFPIWPTPGIVNMAFDAASMNEADTIYPNPFIVVDIGGATTDLHYGSELVANTTNINAKGSMGSNRMVFTDIGMSASSTSTKERLVHHERLYEFLGAIYDNDADSKYTQIKDEGIPDALLPDACFFLALDAAATGTLGMPKLRFDQLEAIVITGGASQIAKADILNGTLNMYLSYPRKGSVKIILDESYSFWLHGIKRTASTTS